MAPKDPNNCLRDVSNVRTNSHTSSNYSNVFKSLGMSPSIKYPNDLSKPPARISPARRSPTKHPIQLTPKRLLSPQCLRDYSAKRAQSAESPIADSNMEPKGPTTSFIFPTSPTRPIFGNERKIGGDGSLGRIRSRFSNGLLSPQRRVALTPSKCQAIPEQRELEAKNLFGDLQNAENPECQDKISAVLTTDKTKTKFETPDEGKIIKPLQSSKKSVKFELPPQNTRERLEKDLKEMRKLLKEAFERQEELELRLSKLENQGKLR